MLTVIGAVAAFLVGVYQYQDKKKQSNKEPFLREQLRLCLEVSDAVARLTIESDGTKWEEARYDFWRLYFGVLCVVEDPDVEKEMIELGNLIPKPEFQRPLKIPISDDAFRRHSIKLAHAARTLILTNWQVKLERPIKKEESLEGDAAAQKLKLSKTHPP